MSIDAQGSYWDHATLGKKTLPLLNRLRAMPQFVIMSQEISATRDVIRSRGGIKCQA
jgi:hypothetical protein